MARPIDDIAKAIQEALSQALKDNADLFNKPVNVTESGGDTGGGGGTGDIVGLILGLAALDALGGVEWAPLIGALKGAQDGGGKEGVSFTVGWFLASTLLQFAEPITRQLQHVIEDANTSQILDPQTAADMVARGFISQSFGESEAGGGGFDKAHFTWMTEAASTYPTTVEALLMWNRGYIGESDVDTLLTRNGIPDTYHADVKKLRQTILSPADWALAALRGNVDQDVAEAGAAQSGLSKEDFATLQLNTGEPPAAQQLDMALRREFITEDEYSKGIRQSRIRDEWIPTMLKLRYFPMSVAQAANAVVRGYMSYDDGATIARQNGLEPAHWEYVYKGNGRPPSHEQARSLYNRGLMTRAQFDQAVRESDIKDKYIDDVFELGVKFLPLFEATALLKEHAITPETFAENMLAQGYRRATVDEIVKSVESGKTGSPKHLSVSDYITLYDAHIHTRDQTIEGLKSLGYTAADAAAIVNVADAKAEAKIMSTLITNVRTQFDRHWLLKDDAITELEQLNIVKSEAEAMVTAWAIVRPDGTRQPTEAQVMKFLKDELITPEEAHTRLRGLGYNDVDAKLLIEAYG